MDILEANEALLKTLTSVEQHERLKDLIKAIQKELESLKITSLK